MDRLGSFFYNLPDKLIHEDSGEHSDDIRLRYHSYFQWQEQVYTYFTQTESSRLFRCFGYPDVDKLYKLLKKADVSQVDDDT